MFPNRFQTAVRQYLNQFLGDKYDKNSNIIERISHHLITENDFREFMDLAVALYESGFLKAAEDYRAYFEKQGIKLEFK
jgi:hypothetical protein